MLLALVLINDWWEIPYGVTNDSLNADVESGLGKARASGVNHYSHCNSQKGGAAGHNYDADAVGQTYGYTKAGAAIAGEVRGGYAPITIHQRLTCVVVKRKDVEKINQENHVEKKKINVVEKQKDLVENARNHVENLNHVKIVNVEPVKRMKGGRYNNMEVMFLIPHHILHHTQLDLCLGLLDLSELIAN